MTRGTSAWGEMQERRPQKGPRTTGHRDETSMGAISRIDHRRHRRHRAGEHQGPAPRVDAGAEVRRADGVGRDGGGEAGVGDGVRFEGHAGRERRVVPVGREGAAGITEFLREAMLHMVMMHQCQRTTPA